ncbi:MAG TPA: HAD-IA family hydrolase [Rhodocyclaceae bacterium]|nr:HAD-IA family hydrolase [Rhodocyclaceae bacterium]
MTSFSVPDSADQFLAVGSLLNWRAPTLRNPVWEPHPEAVSGFAEALSKVAEASRVIVLCDVFNTLVERDVEGLPVIGNQWVATLCGRLDRLGKTVGIMEVQAVYARAIQDAVALAHAEGRSGEYRLRNVIGQVVSHLMPDWSSDRQAALSAVVHGDYLALELRHCRAVAGAAEFLAKLAADYRLIAVSDTPHDDESLRQILSAAGLADYFQEIHASGEAGRNKRSGTLFSHVLEQAGISAEACIHVGDDPMADYVSARAAGMGAVLLQHASVKRRALATARAYELATTMGSPRYLQAESEADPDPAFRLGQEHFAPLLGLFALRVLELHRRFDYERILFVARDGHLLHKTFTEFVAQVDPEHADEIQARCDYVHLSRASTACPRDDDTLDEALRYSTLVAGHSALLSLFQSLGLDTDTYRELMLADGFSEDDFRTADLDTQARFKTCLATSRPLRSALAQDLDDKRKRLLGYLGRTGFLGAGKVLLVDVGWRYRIGKNLLEAVGDHPEFPEVHCALLAFTRELPMGSLVVHDGYAFDSLRASPLEKLFQQAREVVEGICPSTEGTCLGYGDGPEWVPILAAGASGDSVRNRIQEGVLAGVREKARHYSTFGLGHEFRSHALVEFLQPIFVAGHPLRAPLEQLQKETLCAPATSVDDAYAFAARLAERIEVRIGEAATASTGNQILERLLSLVQKTNFSDKPIVLWGAGLLGKLLYPHLEARIGYVVDMNPSLQGQRYGRHAIVSPEALNDNVLHGHLIVFTPLGGELPARLRQGMSDVIHAADWFQRTN